MDYRKVSGSDMKVSVIALGTWAFGNDCWWGHQDDAKSCDVLSEAIASGINLIDTAPIYGRGHSEEVVGKFLQKQGLREQVILATKLGLKWEDKNPKIFHDLTPAKMLEEIDASRKRLRTDYIDIYQVHWPDPDNPIGKTAETMHKFYQKGIIRAVGVSNYSVGQMQEFKKYCPLHTLQPQYSMFERSIESEVVPFCTESNIAIFAYAPLYAGILTGKFFLDNVPIPNDVNRKVKQIELTEPRFSINKEFFKKLKNIASSYGKTLTQLAINWNFNQEGITLAIVGTRSVTQLKDNLGSTDWQISPDDMEKIKELLEWRKEMCIGTGRDLSDKKIK
ncbi:MAG: aldo/keto reductase [Candidatus Omnitrophica bacterium]|nr:aldo/keto reductase [Candidatus Omnitrophota bacterium]